MINFYTVFPFPYNGRQQGFTKSFSVIASSYEDAFTKARLIKGQNISCKIRKDHALKGCAQ